MDENKTTISCEDLINFMNEENKTHKTIKSCGQNIDVTTVLSLEVFDAFVSNAVDMLYNEAGEYIPNLKDFVIRICTVFAYTNVAFPKDFDEVVREMFELMYGTNFYDAVVKVIDQGQYNAFLDAIDESIEYRNNTNIDRVNRQIESLANGIETLGEQFAGMLGDVSEEDVKKLISAVENNQIDEEKLIRAYVEPKEKGEVDG